MQLHFNVPLLKKLFYYHDQSGLSLKAELGMQKILIKYTESSAWAENEREEWEEEKARGRK